MPRSVINAELTEEKFYDALEISNKPFADLRRFEARARWHRLKSQAVRRSSEFTPTVAERRRSVAESRWTTVLSPEILFAIKQASIVGDSSVGPSTGKTSPATGGMSSFDNDVVQQVEELDTMPSARRPLIVRSKENTYRLKDQRGRRLVTNNNLPLSLTKMDRSKNIHVFAKK